MSAKLSTISKLLKEQYEGPIREQLNQEALIYRLFSEGPHEWSGDKVIIPLHTGRNDGIAYLTESTGAPANYVAVPEAGNQSYLDLAVDAKYLYSSFQVTGQAEAKAPGAGGGSEAAFVGAMYSEMRGMEKDVRNSMNKDMFTGQGFHGYLIDNTSEATNTGRRISGANHVVVGAFYQFWHVPADDSKNWVLLNNNDPAPGPGNVTEFECTAVDTALGTATFNSGAGAGKLGPDASAVGPTDLVLMLRVTAIGNDVRPQVNEINGLNCLAFGTASDDCFGNARTGTTNTILRGFGFKSNHAAAPGDGLSSGQPLTLEDMQLVVDAIAERCEEDVDTIIMHRFTRAQYRSLTQEGIRYLPGETSGDLGHRPGDLAFEDMPITVSKDVPFGVIYFLVRDTINTYTLRPGGFQEFTDGGDIVTQKRDQVSGRLTDVREGFWKQYYNMVSELPRAIGVMAGIEYKRA